jgi:hypothetical protein
MDVKLYRFLCDSVYHDINQYDEDERDHLIVVDLFTRIDNSLDKIMLERGNIRLLNSVENRLMDLTHKYYNDIYGEDEDELTTVNRTVDHYIELFKKEVKEKRQSEFDIFFKF